MPVHHASVGHHARHRQHGGRRGKDALLDILRVAGALLPLIKELVDLITARAR